MGQLGRGACWCRAGGAGPLPFASRGARLFVLVDVGDVGRVRSIARDVLAAVKLTVWHVGVGQMHAPVEF
jgi:hypothetical protein